jgi:hypothetical protein
MYVLREQGGPDPLDTPLDLVFPITQNTLLDQYMKEYKCSQCHHSSMIVPK